MSLKIPWQPIETAPKDGTKVLLFWHEPASKFLGFVNKPHDCFDIGFWKKHEAEDFVEIAKGVFHKQKRPLCEGWVTDRPRRNVLLTNYGSIKPTHWMHLTKP